MANWKTYLFLDEDDYIISEEDCITDTEALGRAKFLLGEEYGKVRILRHIGYVTKKTGEK